MTIRPSARASLSAPTAPAATTRRLGPSTTAVARHPPFNAHRPRFSAHGLDPPSTCRLPLANLCPVLVRHPKSTTHSQSSPPVTLRPPPTARRLTTLLPPSARARPRSSAAPARARIDYVEPVARVRARGPVRSRSVTSDTVVPLWSRPVASGAASGRGRRSRVDAAARGGEGRACRLVTQLL